MRFLPEEAFGLAVQNGELLSHREVLEREFAPRSQTRSGGHQEGRSATEACGHASLTGARKRQRSRGQQGFEDAHRSGARTSEQVWPACWSELGSLCKAPDGPWACYSGVVTSTADRATNRTVTVHRLGGPDSDRGQWPGTSMSERMHAVWYLTRQCLAWEAYRGTPARLQRSVARVQRGRR